MPCVSGVGWWGFSTNCEPFFDVAFITEAPCPQRLRHQCIPLSKSFVFYKYFRIVHFILSPCACDGFPCGNVAQCPSLLSPETGPMALVMGQSITTQGAGFTWATQCLNGRGRVYANGIEFMTETLRNKINLWKDGYVKLRGKRMLFSRGTGLYLFFTVTVDCITIKVAFHS